VSLAAGAILIVVFVLWERRLHGDPLIEPRLLANRTYTSGLLVGFAFFGAFGGLLLCVSLFTQLGEGFSPIHAGLTLLAMVLGMFVGMAAGFALVRRLGRHLLHLGVVIVGVGTVVLALTLTGARTASTLDLAPGLLLIGVGAGISMGQVFDFILAGVSMDEVGSATGVVEAMQQLASAVGVAVLGTIFFSAFAGHLATHALAITAWACLVPIAAAFVLIFRLPMRARERHT
jgi:predicted MFS family arabinose efflux permease